MRGLAGARSAAATGMLLLASAVRAQAPVVSTPATTVVHLVAFSDYHSHALPFTSEGRPDQGGLARAVAFLKEARRRPHTLVVSGGDMVNRGSPLWSDVYGCVEWEWLAGLVDVWAAGNHDFDYGPQAFAACRTASRAPVLAANLVDASGAPVFTVDGKPYVIKTEGAIRIGLFGLGGPDLERLVPPENLPPGTHWIDPLPVARQVVAALRPQADAVVFIGHQTREDDEAMARAVPGIDLVLGTHSHFKGPLVTIPGTRTRYISPYQYFTYVSQVDLEFAGRTLREIRGGLVPIDARVAEDPTVAAEVDRRRRDLLSTYPERFHVVGRAPRGLSDEGLSSGESAIGNWATEVLRRVSKAQAYLATASSFRGGLPAGDVTLEDFYMAVPYPNRVVIAEMTGAQVAELVAASLARAGSDGFSQQSGLRYRIASGRPSGLQILRDAARPQEGFVPVDPKAVYRIGTSDYQAKLAAGYKDLFAAARALTATDIDAQKALLDELARAPAEAALDGRSGASPR